MDHKIMWEIDYNGVTMSASDSDFNRELAYQFENIGTKA